MEEIVYFGFLRLCLRLARLPFLPKILDGYGPIESATFTMNSAVDVASALTMNSILSVTNRLCRIDCAEWAVPNQLPDLLSRRIAHKIAH